MGMTVSALFSSARLPPEVDASPRVVLADRSPCGSSPAEAGEPALQRVPVASHPILLRPPAPPADEQEAAGRGGDRGHGLPSQLIGPIQAATHDCSRGAGPQAPGGVPIGRYQTEHPERWPPLGSLGCVGQEQLEDLLDNDAIAMGAASAAPATASGSRISLPPAMLMRVSVSGPAAGADLAVSVDGSAKPSGTRLGSSCWGGAAAAPIPTIQVPVADRPEIG